MIINVPTEGKTLTGVLVAGETSLTLSSDSVNSDSTIDIYTSVYGVNPTEVTLNNGSVVLAFDSQESDINVKVRVS